MTTGRFQITSQDGRYVGPGVELGSVALHTNPEHAWIYDSEAHAEEQAMVIDATMGPEFLGCWQTKEYVR